MSLLERFDPPAHLPDFGALPGLLDQWHSAMSKWFDFAISNEKQTLPSGATVQFYNPAKFDPGAPAVDQAVTWNAFPKELLRRYGRDRALREADTLKPLSHYSPRLKGSVFDRTPYRPLNEYCEWHVVRDSDTGKIKKITFSSEPPEYWKALYGGTYLLDDGNEYTFSGSPQRVLELYREMVSPEVQAADLISREDIVADDGTVFAKKGGYNPYNKWNTTHGIMHLCSPPNTLVAEIELGADATVARQDARGRTLVEPDALICCAAYGGPDRNSDPTIGAAVNALARLGAYVTLRNPVGLYMDHVDVVGWSAPDGSDVSECVRVVRGGPGMIERLIVEVPAERGFTVGDLKIGGVPVNYGGQIAECITVKLVGTAVLPPAEKPFLKVAPVPCDARCCIDPNNATVLERAVRNAQPVPPGKRPAFVNEGTLPAAATRAGGGETAERVLAISVKPSPAESSAIPPKHRRHRRVP